MPRSCNEDLLFRAMSMKEFLGYNIDLVAATLHMSTKTIQHYVLKCLNTDEVLKHAGNFDRPTKQFPYASARGVCNHGSSKFIKMILIMSQTTFQDCRVHFCAFFPTIFLEIAVYKILFGTI